MDFFFVEKEVSYSGWGLIAGSALRAARGPEHGLRVLRETRVERSGSFGFAVLVQQSEAVLGTSAAAQSAVVLCV